MIIETSLVYCSWQDINRWVSYWVPQSWKFLGKQKDITGLGRILLNQCGRQMDDCIPLPNVYVKIVTYIEVDLGN
jgi:hypothetical protein